MFDTFCFDDTHTSRRLHNFCIPTKNVFRVGHKKCIPTKPLLAGQVLLGVDPFMLSDARSAARRAAAESVYARTRGALLPLTSREASALVADGVMDFVFLDARKEDMDEDISLWAPKVRDGGLVMGHDFSAEFPAAVEAVLCASAVSGGLHLGRDATWWFVKLDGQTYGACTLKTQVKAVADYAASELKRLTSKEKRNEA